MATYLLTWNPDRWGWEEQAACIAEIRRGGTVAGKWSCGRTRRVVAGDRLFLMRCGRGDAGLIASALATGVPYHAQHWDERSPGRGEALYVSLEWDVVSSEPIIGRAELLAEYPSVHWRTQLGGIRIEPDTARRLEHEWQRRAEPTFEPLPDQEHRIVYREGATRMVVVNAYERSRRARQACLDCHGRVCSVCGLDPKRRYGEDAERIIQVHHLTQISRIGHEYALDPVRDLRPVCPTCHAILHMTDPPRTIMQARDLIGGGGIPEGAHGVSTDIPASSRSSHRQSDKW